MKIGIRAALLAGLLASGLAWAGGDGTNQTLRLELDLVDGSRVIGVPKLESVPVQTSYAKMDIPLAQITTVVMGDDHETATLDLRNGDKVKGVLSLRPLDMETVFGNIKIGIENIKTFCVVAGDGALAATLKRGLLLHYACDRDEGGVVSDMSDKDNKGRVNGGKWVAKGAGGGAFDFDGRGASITSAGKVRVETQAVTLSAWVNVRSFSQCVEGKVIKIHTADYRDAWLAAEAYDGSKLRFGLYDASGVAHEVAFSGPVTLGKWYHLVGTYDGQKMALYVDGELSSASDWAGGLVINDMVFIGRDHSGLQPFDGMIDDVRIYDRALTAAEARTLARSAAPAP